MTALIQSSGSLTIHVAECNMYNSFRAQVVKTGWKAAHLMWMAAHAHRSTEELQLYNSAGALVLAIALNSGFSAVGHWPFIRLQFDLDFCRWIFCRNSYDCAGCCTMWELSCAIGFIQFDQCRVLVPLTIPLSKRSYFLMQTNDPSVFLYIHGNIFSAFCQCTLI